MASGSHQTFKQTDTAAPCGAIQACSAHTNALVYQGRQAQVGGTGGTTDLTAFMQASATRNFAAIELAEAAAKLMGYIEAGDWTVRCEITVSNADCSWVSTYLCVLNAACSSVATVASATGLGISLASTGVKSHTLSIAAPYKLAAGEKPYLVLVAQNIAFSNALFRWKASQNIETTIQPIQARMRRRR